MERRWLLSLGPPLVATLALGLVASSSLGAADRAWDPPPCPSGPAGLIAAATSPDASEAGPPVPEAWFTIDPRLDASGMLDGQRLRLGLGRQRSRHVALPAESSAAGPFGRVVLVVGDDGRRSGILAIDAHDGCGWRLGGSPDVIRRATLDPATGAVYEFRVDRKTRADLGVWRRGLDGSQPRRVLDPLPPDEPFGRTFTTTLGWSIDGGELAVQQCGVEQCRTRLLDPATSAVTVFDDPAQGLLIGVAEGGIVFHGECVALPCTVESRATPGEPAAILAQAAGLAALVETPDGPAVALETPDGGEVRRLDGSLASALAPPASDARLVPSLHGATAGHGLPPDWVAWSPDARSPDGATLTRLSDGEAVRLVEVTR